MKKFVHIILLALLYSQVDSLHVHKLSSIPSTSSILLLYFRQAHLPNLNSRTYYLKSVQKIARRGLHIPTTAWALWTCELGHRICDHPNAVDYINSILNPISQQFGDLEFDPGSLAKHSFVLLTHNLTAPNFLFVARDPVVWWGEEMLWPHIFGSMILCIWIPDTGVSKVPS